MNQHDKHFLNDESFLKLFPPHIHTQNKNHYTPIEVAKVASGFLTMDAGAKILDVGSGIGKFCLTAAFLHHNCEFYGVEQRSELVDLSNEVKHKLDIKNAHFIHGNMDQEKLKNYDHIYFFNSFHEQLDDADKLDSSILHNENLYHYYNSYFYKQLALMPSGTRLAAFFTLEHEIPESYMIVKESFGGNLKMMLKI